MNRRNFITGVTTGLAGLSLGSNLNAAPATEKNKKEEELKIRKYNPLGKTGLKVSDVIFGSVRVFSANALSYAYDLGINTFDTAESYMQGKSEEFVGQALSKVRDKVTIITKHSHRGKFNKTAFLERFHKSLKRMKTDYVDIAYLHAISDLEIFKNQELLATYEQLRKEGKLRFTGFSFHTNMAKILKGTDNPEILKFAQVILFTYNHMEGEALKPLVKNLRKKGVGTVAMKTLAGGKQRTLKPFVKGNVSYPQAAVSWVLSNRDIDCAVPT
ncbi:MAG: aldo/keto reductase, partial [bacterium]|nr:aldo/keto reductase [bacterium]